MVSDIINSLRNVKFKWNTEKELQLQIYNLLKEKFPLYEISKEYILDEENIIDFLIEGIGIEVKIKGQRRAIYKQCERYCSFEKVSTLILVTAATMGFPKEMNGKDCYIFNLNKAWL